MMRYFECPHCRETPTAEEWNTYNEQAIITLGLPKLPEGYDEQDDAASLDCPACEERVMLTDLMEF